MVDRLAERSAEGRDPAQDVDALLARCLYRGEAIGWDDVVGHEAARRELAIVVETFRRPWVAENLGLAVTRGILITGPAGCGKSMLARALAASVDRPVYVVPAAEVDAPTIRRVYEALAGTECVVVWDEADVVLRGRWSRGAQANGRLVAAFCAAIDGIEPRHGPITIALTAEPEYELDRAACRAGRLTTKITLGLPDREERRELWARYLSHAPVTEAINLDRAADRSVGMTGADIAAIVGTALGLGMVERIDAVSPALLDEAILRGHHVEERPEFLTPAALRRSAIHEGGHVALAVSAFGVAAISSVTVRPRGLQTGSTALADEWTNDRLLDRGRLRDAVRMSFAGLVAEEMEYGMDGVSLGVAEDLSRGTTLLRRLAADLGADETIGPIDLDGLERGYESDRGSNPMRDALWESVQSGALAHLAETWAILKPRRALIGAFADRLLAAPDLTLSGDALTAALRECGLG